MARVNGPGVGSEFALGHLAAGVCIVAECLSDLWRVVPGFAFSDGAATLSVDAVVCDEVVMMMIVSNLLLT